MEEAQDSANDSFGALLRRLRLERGLTQEELAEQAHLSVRGLSDLERGVHQRARPETVTLLANALSLDPTERAHLNRLLHRTAARHSPVAGPVSERPRPDEHPRPRHNLPLPTTSYVARAGELEQVTRRLRDSRLLTLTGSGGCGKTRLAREVAREVLDEFPDGVWSVELAPLADPSLVPQAIATVLDVREIPGRPLLDTLVDYLRRPRPLLILDNCEHLIDACAQVADTLLRTCPDVRILATSRELLGVAGETAWRVPSLPVPPPGADTPTRGHGDAATAVAGVEEYAAVQLFVARAQLVAPSFTLTPENAETVARICRRLDGIPLAIELAAARLYALSVEQILARLDQRFRLLSGGNRTALRRQQTMRATIDWSYQLLGERERTLLRRLAVFAGGWTLEAAEAVAASPPSAVADDPDRREELEAEEIFDLLIQLVEKSLVQRDESPPGTDGQVRYRLSETMRQYAEEKLLEAGEAAAVRNRHRDWFLALAETARAELEGPDQAVWFKRLDREHDNLRAALDWCQADEEGAEFQLRLAGALGRFWIVRWYLHEGRSRLESALARPGAISPYARALALNWAGNLERHCHNPAYARELLEEGLPIARAVGDRSLLCQVMRHLAITLLGLGEVQRARPLLEEGLVIARESGSPRDIGWQLSMLGETHLIEGSIEVGEGMIAESLVAAQRSGDALTMTPALTIAGQAAMVRGDYPAARTFYDEAWLAAQRVGDNISGLSVIHLKGRLAICEGDRKQARHWDREWLARAPASRRLEVTQGLLLAGGIAVADGQYQRAARLFGAAASEGSLHRIPSPDEWDRWLTSLHDDFYDPWIRSQYAQELATTRAHLGEELFAREWAQGQALARDEAIQLALAEGDGETPV